MISFNIPPVTGDELEYIKEVLNSHRLCGDGPFTKKCQAWLENRLQNSKVLLTTSGTSALDMAALLCGLEPGDEVIIPSFTFSSTATAPALTGARLVYVDLRPDTMNIDEKKIENAITDKTKVIIVMHYGGVSCDMDTIMDIAKRHHLMVIEDAAQAMMASWKGKPLGTFGDVGCFSFHETKNYSMGEGGAIAINNPDLIERAEILREKGTDRAKFFRGQVDKYTWVDIGDSFLPSELNAACLWAQLQKAEEINNSRLAAWNRYAQRLVPLVQEGLIDVQHIPNGAVHNAHMFYIKVKDLQQRTDFISWMREGGIGCVFHYVPLHSAPAGLKYGRFHGEDVWTTKESERLVRLPLYYGMQLDQVNEVCKRIEQFFMKDNRKAVQV